MNLSLLILTSIGLALDGFAISIVYGTYASSHKLRIAIKLSVIFGIFHILMPLIGYLAGIGIKQYIEAVDHWVAFLILLYIGIKMILEGKKENRSGESKEINMRFKIIFYIAFATSIDALAVGISFSLIEIPIFQTVGIIGLTAFIFSFAGVWFGKIISKNTNFKIQIIGGIILICIGSKILIEHIHLHYMN